MNLLRRFLDRRKTNVGVETNRRKPSMRDIDEQLFNAISDLEKTVITKRKPVVVHDSPWNHVEFASFAETCQHRYQNGSLHAICKHPDHDGKGTGVAACNKVQCPMGKK